MNTEVKNISMALKGDILIKGLLFPEGPAFAPDGSLWLVELHGQSLVQLNDGKVERFNVDGKPNGIAIDKQGVIWFCDAEMNAVRCYDSSTGYSHVMVDNVNGKALTSPNDLAFDMAGNLVFTCPGNSRNEPTGYVCVLQKNGVVKKIIEQKYFPNGLAFTPDGKQLVIAETYRHRLWKGDWDSDNCEWGNGEVFAETGGPIGPDGMAFDNEGNLFVAVYGSGKIKIINAIGNVIEELPLLGNNPTNCAFDPIGKLGLVVTEAEGGCLVSIVGKHKGAKLFG